MTRLASRIAAVGLVVALVLGGGDARATTRTPSHRMTGFGTEQVALLDWALGLFDQAGLALPPIDFVRHPTTAGCFGRAGAHTFAGGRSTIHICAADAGPLEEFLLLHELAHAWDRRGLDDERRAAFLRLRGLTEWRNDDPERWGERGAEHAAEIVMWGLMDRPIQLIRIRATGCADLLAGYVTLTGRPPLHGYTDYCD